MRAQSTDGAAGLVTLPCTWRSPRLQLWQPRRSAEPIMSFPRASTAAATTYCALALRTLATPNRHFVRIAALSRFPSFFWPLGDFF